jgi:polyribonucleotide 5'-hydroxyl-kinase
MSLPGLELTQPSEERQLAVAPPSQIALNPGSEWRFEVAFGHLVKVKVCSNRECSTEGIAIYD